MTRRAPLPPELLQGPFRVATALALGATPSRLRNSDVHPLLHGVRSAQPVSPHRLITALAPAEQAGFAMSHASAAVLHDLRRPWRLDAAPPSIGVIGRVLRPPRRAGVDAHRLPADARTVVLEGVRILHPIDTWVSLAPRLEVDELIAMGDGIVGGREPAHRLGDLASAVSAAAGRRGVERLRLALPQIREHSDSVRETRLRLMIVRSGLPEPLVNPPIFNSLGARIAHGDLVYEAEKVLVEYDGEQHRIDSAQYAIDIARLDELMEEGWRVIRVTKALMPQQATVIGKVRTALEQRRAEGARGRW